MLTFFLPGKTAESLAEEGATGRQNLDSSPGGICTHFLSLDLSPPDLST
jgi:hypothetical protein